MTTAWRVAEAGRQRGPLGEDEVKAARRRGELSRRALVWTDGMTEWRPIDEVFPGHGAKVARGAVAEGLALTLLSPVFLLTGAAAVYINYLGGLDRVPPAHASLVWSAVSLTLAATALAAPATWWRWAGRREGVEARGMARILAVILAVSGLGLAGLMLYQAPLVAELVGAMEKMRTYRFDYQPKTRTLAITGMIGPGFARTLKDELRVHDIARVEIESQGGLLQEALDGARALEQRPGLQVVARWQCASACITLLMGGPQRLADYDMGIDFHASDLVAARDNRWSVAMSGEQARKAERYMIKRGAPADLIAKADRLGPGKLYRAASVDLLERGMLTGLVDEDGQAVSLIQAKALLKEREAEEGGPLVTTGSFLNR